MGAQREGVGKGRGVGEIIMEAGHPSHFVQSHVIKFFMRTSGAQYSLGVSWTVHRSLGKYILWWFCLLMPFSGFLLKWLTTQFLHWNIWLALSRQTEACPEKPLQGSELLQHLTIQRTGERIQDVRLGKRRLNVDQIAVFKPLESCQKRKGLGWSATAPEGIDLGSKFQGSKFALKEIFSNLNYC